MLGSAARSGQDLGSPVVLARYERQQLPVNLAMSAAVDVLKRAYEMPRGPLASLRGVGVNLLNALGPVKQLLAGAAMHGLGTTTTGGSSSSSNDNNHLPGSSTSTTSHPTDWLQAEDQASGKAYFYHRHTREARWERPV